MKILQIIQKPQLRGAEIFACQLSTELRNKGVETDVVCLFEHPNILPYDLHFIALGANSGSRFWDFKAYRRLSRIIKNGRYDLVQANAGDTLKYAVISKFLFSWNAPLVFRNANKMSDFIRGFFHLKLSQWFLSKCNFFISVSENCRKDLITILPSAVGRSATIMIGTYNFSDIHPIFPMDPHNPVIINIGSFVPEKNHSFLIDVFHLFYKRTGKGYLWLVGDGKLRHELEEKVRSLSLGERVRFWGYRKDAIAILKAAHVMVMPSKIEGVPGVILEALSCGIPVIAAAVGGIPEVIQNNSSGFCIDSEDVQEYENRLTEVLFNAPMRNSIVAFGKEMIQKDLLMPVIANKFLNTYRQLTG